MRTLRMEPLENRALLAVTATISGGVLKVMGDADANTISITASGANYTVSGLTAGDRSFAASQVKSIKIETLAGDDAVTVNLTGATGIGGRGNLSITTRDGADTVTLLGVTVGGSVNVDTGSAASAGKDTVSATDVKAGRDVSIRTGTGNDAVAVDSVLANALKIATGTGEDTINAGQAPGTLDIEVHSLDVKSGDGNDVVALTTQTTRNANIDLGAGNDGLALAYCRKTGDQDMTKHEAYDAGYDAYWAGVDESDNPCDAEEDPENRRAWDEGWRKARADDYDESD